MVQRGGFKKNTMTTNMKNVKLKKQSIHTKKQLQLMFIIINILKINYFKKKQKAPFINKGASQKKQ